MTSYNASGPSLTLDLTAFRANVAHLIALVSPARTMVAVKADAYGHGALPFARAALEAGAHSLAVLEVPAALALREAAITAPLFAWLHGREADFAAAIGADVDLGVSSRSELDAIMAAATVRGLRASVHLKIDTGLHRNGANAEDWPSLVAAAVDAEAAGRVRIAGLWSHLADTSPEDDAQALDEFRAAVAVAVSLGVPSAGEPGAPLLHLAASSAGIRMPEARLDLVRFGIAAYGVSPFDDVDARGLGLRPVMTSTAPVLAVDDGIAVIAAGFADGVPPSVLEASGSGAWLLLGGERREIDDIDVDTLSVLLGDGPAVEVGDTATLFGPGDDGEPTAQEWAVWAGTNGDEIVARAGARAIRTYS